MPPKRKYSATLNIIENAWDKFYSGDPTKNIEQQDSTPSYDAIYTRPLPRHVDVMYDMATKSIDEALARGDKKAYFFEDGCGSGRYRSVPQKLSEYANGKDIHLIWIGHDISQQGLNLYKNKLLEEGFDEGAGYTRFPLEGRAECVTKDNLTYKFLKSTEKTTAQELEKKIGVVVENSFDVFGIDGYRLDEAQRLDMMAMRGRITRNGLFFTVAGPAYSRITRHFDQKRKRGDFVGSATHDGDVEYKRGNLDIPFHTFTEPEIYRHLRQAELEGSVSVSNTIHEKDGLLSSEAIDAEDMKITAETNRSNDSFLRSARAVYWEVVANSTLAKNPSTGRVIAGIAGPKETLYR